MARIAPCRLLYAALWAGVCSCDRWCWQNPLPQGLSLTGVWGSDPSNVWAVGHRGIILRWNGLTWTASAYETTASLNSVWEATPTTSGPLDLLAPY